MSDQRYFSEVAELRRPTTGLFRGEIPERVRNAMMDFVSRPNQWLYFGWGWSFCVRALDWPPSFAREHPSDALEPLVNHVQTGGYADWLDLMQAMYVYLADVEPELSDGFRNRLNEALVRHYSAYVMEPDGQVVEPGSAVSQAATQRARAILADPRFDGPDRQFQDAILDMTRRPEPNNEGAIAGALAALEGVCRIVLNDRKVMLTAAINRIGSERGLHKALVTNLSNLYGYASDAGGRHGLVGKPDADESIAEFAVHQSAAAIVLVARLYGFAVA